MELGLAHSSLAMYRAIKSGDTGLNLKLSDLIDKEIKFPNLYEIIKSFFTRRSLTITIKAYPDRLINKLMNIQKEVDEEIEDEIEKAKRGIK